MDGFLNDAQIRQFISSTVLPHHRTLTRTGTVSLNVHLLWSTLANSSQKYSVLCIQRIHGLIPFNFNFSYLELLIDLSYVKFYDCLFHV